jgi:hypothetical protein
MSAAFFVIAAIATLSLAALLVWALRGASHRKTNDPRVNVFESAPRHLRNMAQIRQAMDSADLQYAEAKGGPRLSARIRRERRQVTLLYLAAIRRDFEQSLRVARVVAALSPEVSGSQEYERVRLSVVFSSRFYVVKLCLHLGNVAQPQMLALGQMSTSLAMQMEQTMARLGERAALAAELALQSDQYQ